MAALQPPLGAEQIKALIPHRYPFLLLDRVIDLEPGKRVVGLKQVSLSDPFLQGHFPDYPVMPGVLIVEALAQAGAVLRHAGVSSVRPGGCSARWSHRALRRGGSCCCGPTTSATCCCPGRPWG